MRFRHALVVLLVVTAMAGCRQTTSGQNTRTVTEPPQQQQSSPQTSAFVETIKFKQAESEIRITLGEPDRVRQVDSDTAWLVYDQLGVEVGLLKGRVYSVVQKKGALSSGLQVGSPESKTAELHLPLLEDGIDRKTYVVDRGDGEIWVIVKAGQVASFVLTPYRNAE